MLEKEPNDSFLNYALAIELEKENKIPEAISLLEKILARNENYLGAYYKLGKLYETANEKQKAKQVFFHGAEVARIQKNIKALAELNEALEMLEE